LPAVDGEHGPVHEPRIARAQPNDRIRDFLGFTKAIHGGMSSDYAFISVCGAREIGAHHLRLREAGRYRVDPQTHLAVVDGCGFNQADDPELADDLGGVTNFAWLEAVD
jgi:hypothetical protein